jgi:hypothetical protein
MHPILKTNVDWIRRPALALFYLAGAIAFYILSLGPVLYLYDIGFIGGWKGFPQTVRIVYAPLKPLVTDDLDTPYGQYLLWCTHFRYREHLLDKPPPILHEVKP